ncbi:MULTISPECIES: HAD family hydrolase [unclassified Thermosynechococcus]|uniref:HAD family hydrolase n=1 Tax=unclassified Thermosynechococcus TaxID=2622553 RepID=UPI0019811FB7|nr:MULTISPECIES: HAD family hydrolase [unclassified Thermosynechococcus]QSF49860.1 HAD family hydrolase [Thermosynechococcus sp. TA-1]WNC22958.1 HAD family hydrolase [Thermosynechococcus sp. PP22]WNC33200.1 HAD family hydrolase [Thermosynechococcus sp. PKX95]WNC35724.1 HAD family hydrolase [Thermosynechococcus sp. PKX91]WNC38248.1 HAD family hydrolase [Thermosynechococcus sp. WL11]
MVRLSCRGHAFEPVAAVIFDKDGTLADVAEYLKELAIARAAAVADHFPNLKQLLLQAFGVRGEHLDAGGLQAVGTRQENLIAAAALVASQGVSWIAALELVSTAFEAAELKFTTKAALTPPLPRVIELVQQLHGMNCALAIISGDRRSEIEAFLDTYHLKPFFQCWQGGDEPPTKPDPQVLLRVCDRLGVRPDQTVVIGDADSDGLMAQRGGAAGSIGVTWGWHRPPVLNYCDCILASPLEMQISAD